MACPVPRTLAYRCAALVGVFPLLLPGHLAAQGGALSGIVQDSATREPLPAVRIEAVRAGAVAAAIVTDRAGAFRLGNLPPGHYVITARRIGYRPRQADNVPVVAGETRVIDLALVARPVPLDEVVISASRAPETALYAPAAVTVLDTWDVQQRPALTLADHLPGTPGVDVATTGITQHAIVARGFNNAASGRLLTLVDYRYAAVPSLRINAYNFIPTTNDDIERVELVRGPGAALYGPNSADGVLHVITRSPFEWPGTSVRVAGGNRQLRQMGVRHAEVLGGRLGLRLSAQYLEAEDWEFQDPEEAMAREQAIRGGADPSSLLVGRRDPTIQRAAADFKLEWRPAARTSLAAAVGVNQAINNVDITPLGAVQVRDWRYLYGQSQLRHHGFSANLFVNTSDAGETFLLRQGRPVTDRSQQFVGQLNQRLLESDRQRLSAGLDIQRTVPRTEGTVMGRNELDDDVNEVGGYLHSETRLAPAVDLILAARLDYHDRLEDVVLSSRAGIVLEPATGHAFRLTYNRGYEAPSTDNFFLDLAAGSIPGYDLRAVGVPSTGFTFPRSCGGLCMRSPFTPAALGGPAQFLPLDVTPLWTVVVEQLREQGIDLTQVPPPSAADVGTVLAVLNPNAGANPALEPFVPVAGVRDISRLTSTITQTVELGYKGILGDGLYVAVDLYSTRKTDFVGPLRIETPNALLDRASLAAYLAQFMPEDQAAALALGISLIPLGVVTPQEARDPTDILFTHRNFGDVTLWGVDLAVTLLLTRSVSLDGTYSWTSDDFFANAGGIADLALNAPANKGSATITLRNERRGLHGELGLRAVAGFPVLTGVYTGEVNPYAVLDAGVGYRLPVAGGLTVSVRARNLLNHRHQEFVGVPAIGRLVIGLVRVEL